MPHGTQNQLSSTLLTRDLPMKVSNEFAALVGVAMAVIPCAFLVFVQQSGGAGYIVPGIA